MWIRTLAERAQVGHGTLRVVGEAVRTATPLRWTLSRNGVVVQQGSVQPLAADGGPLAPGARGDWRLALDVAVPGPYTLVVAQPADDGSSAATWQDSKAFSVG